MFTAESPASSIHELIEYLRSDEPERHLFRGQIRHWPTLVPSIFRRALADPIETGRILRINRDAFHRSLDERSRIRFRLMNHLIKRFGKGIGNIIAQQYGISSEAIDVTSAVEIAAFFATRTWPEYTHFSGSSSNDIGVIYRFPSSQVIRHIEGLDNVTDLIGTWVEGVGRVYCLQYRKPADLGPELTAELRKSFDELGGPQQAKMITQPIVVATEALSGMIAQALARPGWSHVRRYELTRLARQKGGFIRPPFHWICSLPRDAQIIYNEATKLNLFAPTVALAEDFVAIENTMYFPGMTPFFFRHGGDEVTAVTRRQLWPSSHEDDLYERLVFHAVIEAHDYLEADGVTIDDPRTGILDRGFSTGAERIGWEGYGHYGAGRYREAIAAYTTVIAADADDDIAHINRGNAYYELGELDSALRDLQRATALNPHSAAAWSGYGLVLLARGDLDAALAAFDRGLTCDDRKPMLHVNRADTLELLGRYAEAHASLDRALELSPGNAAAIMARRSVIFARSGDHEAAERCVRTLEQSGGDTTLLRQTLETFSA